MLKGDLFRAAGLKPLPFFQCAHEIARIQKRGMGARVQPGIAAPHGFHLQGPFGQVGLQQFGDLKLSAFRRLDGAGPFRGGGVQKIKPRHRIARGWHGGLFDDLTRAAFLIKGHHAVPFGIGNVIAKHRTARRFPVRRVHQFRQAMPKEDVVAEDHGRGRPIQKLFGQNIGLRQTLGAGLHLIAEFNTPLRAVAQRLLELVLILRGGDDADLADTGQHQDA